jgi:hypothetical protein
VSGARARRVLGPAVALPGVDAELDLDDEHPDGDIAVEQEDDDVGAVLGGPDLGQIDRDEARFGVGGERDAERFGEELGAERGAVLEEIDEDLVGHGCHGGDNRTHTSASAIGGSSARTGGDPQASCGSTPVRPTSRSTATPAIFHYSWD